MTTVMNYLAHLIIEDDNKKREQTLKDHNRNVAEYCAEALEACGLSSVGKLAGLLHDGKGTEKFQQYLEQSAAWEAYEKGIISIPECRRPVKGSVNHTFAGCIYLLERYHKQKDLDENACLANYTSEIIACAISSHHGLFDLESLDGANGFAHRLMETDREKIQYVQAKQAFEQYISSEEEIDNLFRKAEVEILKAMRAISYNARMSESTYRYLGIEFAMLERMLTSALMYADRRDTAEFADQKDYADLLPDWDRDIKDFERKYCRMCNSLTPINQLRLEIADQCRDFAKVQPGIYRLNVPTGGGKTLSSLRYSLYHARNYHKKRIIYVIPLLSIIDQNAEELESYLPNERVLEHHSDVVIEKKHSDELEQYDLMKDRWTAPVIITTMVQILDILFSAKTQTIARMRALCDSVMIFDEVQSVPVKTLMMFNSAINFLAAQCRTTVILCSATQPEFESLKEFPLNVSDKIMVRLEQKQLQLFKRHDYHIVSDDELEIGEVIEKAVQIEKQQNPLMIVCNTKSEAIQIYQGLRDRVDSTVNIRHLSASMCKEHRKLVLGEVQEKLNLIQKRESQDALILVTTQLVEAGVNLSFRSVMRVLAGNDNLVQAAGRCNRSNEYGTGDVYLVRLKSENRQLRNLPDIMDCQQAMLNTIHFEHAFIPDQPDFIRSYYKYLFSANEREEKTKYPFDRNGVRYFLGSLLTGFMPESETYAFRQPFKTVGEQFLVFDDLTYTVLVPYQKGKEIIEELDMLDQMHRELPARLFKVASGYSIQIFKWQLEKLSTSGMIRSIFEQQIYVLDSAAYCEEFGLNIQAEWSVENLLF